MADPEPGRLNYRGEQFRRFEEDVEGPRYEAAIAWQDQCSGSEMPLEYERLADEGRAKGYGPAIRFGDARTQFIKTNQAYLTTPRLGREYPTTDFDGDLRGRLGSGHDLLRTALEEAEKEARGPTAPASPTVSPAPVDRPPGIPAEPNCATGAVEAPVGPIETAIAALSRYPETVRLLCYLSGQPNKRAHLDKIATDLDKARPITAGRRRRTIRQRYNRARDQLERSGSPVRLTIDDNVIEMVIVGDAPGGTTSRATQM
jgi:hypothetical protein